jgi:hypothetical protein
LVGIVDRIQYLRSVDDTVHAQGEHRDERRQRTQQKRRRNGLRDDLR